jgi:hypothetical protein
MNEPEEYCYVALHNCGGWQGLIVDCPEMKKDNAKHLARWIRGGLIIERWTIEKARQPAVSCKCLRKPQQKELL